MPNKVTIESAVNGYLVTITEHDDDQITIKKYLFSADEHIALAELSCSHEADDTAAFVDVVNFLADYFGVSGSKHDKARFKCCMEDQKGKTVYPGGD